MMLLLRWLISIVAIILSSYVLPGVTLSGFWPAFWLALVLGLINVILKPLLVLITLPINILTLGLFTFIINALLILLASNIVNGFSVDGFWYALLFSIVLSIFSFLLNKLLPSKD